MKLVSYKRKDENRFGIWINEKVYDVAEQGKKVGDLPSTMKEFLWNSEEKLPLLKKLQDEINQNPTGFESVPNPELVSPVPEPTSCRDAYAFRQHVETMRKNRGVEMAPEFDQFPIFYFTNHNATMGPGEVLVETDHFERLDFELEVAAVVGKKGINIPAEKADDYIIGFMIMNDLSARRLQMEEMKLSLGPAKGKDFSNTFGPYLVTKDELQNKIKPTAEGNHYSLQMKAYHNGKQVSDGNMDSMTWTFAQILERVSYGVEVYPGDVIGSGTVGTGCYAELNSTGSRLAKEQNKEFTPTWIEDGDSIDLEIEGLGLLKNTIKRKSENYSILAKKKNV